MAHIVPELATLHDIHLPPSISPWALAPGWYALMMVMGSIGFLIFLKIRRSRTHRKFKQHILHMLITIEQAHTQTLNSQKTSASVSELLRRVALMCYPREQVAGLQGHDWLMFLSQTSSGNFDSKTIPSWIDFTALHTALLEYPYQPPAPPEQANSQMESLFQAARNWIKNQALSSPSPDAMAAPRSLAMNVKKRLSTLGRERSRSHHESSDFPPASSDKGVKDV